MRISLGDIEVMHGILSFEERRRRFKRLFMTVLIGAVALTVLLCLTSMVQRSNAEFFEIKVTRVERVNDKYLIFTETEVFENTDAPILGKYNSSDLYSRLQPGRRYRIKVVGFRIPAASTYRNIVEVETIP